MDDDSPDAFKACLREQAKADLNTVLTKDKSPLVNLCRNIVVGQRLSTLGNAELAVLLLDHVYSRMSMTDPRSELISEVMNRLGYVGPPDPEPEG